MLPLIRMHKRRKHKKHVARTPEAVAKYKELFLAQLQKGRSPGVAARNIKIARATAYGWKKEDFFFRRRQPAINCQSRLAQRTFMICRKSRPQSAPLDVSREPV